MTTSRRPSPQPFPASRLASAGLLAVSAALAGCATQPASQPPLAHDPLEPFNRQVTVFNDTVDGALIKPITLAYHDLTPRPLRDCISNIFGNIGDVWSAANSFLQGRGHDFFNTLGRVLFNSTMGLGGCIDVASMNGARRIPNDLGVTLGVWGLDAGPYLVLPFLGPSSVRDGVATLGSFAASISPTTPLFAIDNIPLRNATLGLYAIDLRDGLLDADRLVTDVALDRYSFIRDAYLQRREAMVNRGSDELPDYGDDDDDDAAAPSAGATPAPAP